MKRLIFLSLHQKKKVISVIRGRIKRRTHKTTFRLATHNNKPEHIGKSQKEKK